MKKALIVVDAQYDFMDGGSLAVPNGSEIIPVINHEIKQHDIVIFTRDFHPANHKSFASQHEDKNEFDTIDLNGLEQVLWPDHCIQNHRGSDLHDDIEFENCKEFYIFKKGIDPEVDSYSGFYDNGGKNSTGLSEFLKDKGITDLTIMGLAGEYCVKFTALDAIKEGFKVKLNLNGIRFLSQKTFKVVHIQEMLDAGIEMKPIK